MTIFTFTIITASVVGGIINSLISQRSKLKKYVSFLVTIVCTLSLLQPITEILSSTAKLKESATEFFSSITVQDKINVTNEIIVNTSKSKIESGIKELVTDKFKLESDEVSVEIILNEENIEAIKIEKICVYITGKSSWSDTDKIKDYLKSIIDTEILVKRR